MCVCVLYIDRSSAVDVTLLDEADVEKLQQELLLLRHVVDQDSCRNLHICFRSRNALIHDLVSHGCVVIFIIR